MKLDLAVPVAGTVSKAVFLCVAGLFGACAAYGANLVLNPGFETGDFTNWTTDININWGVNSSTFGITGPHSGKFFANSGCIGASCITTPDAFLFQDLTTAVNQTYTLTFWYDRGTNGSGITINSTPIGTGPEELLVLWNGTPAIDLAQTTSGNADPGWTQFTVQGLKASATSTRLEFRGRQDPAHLGLDDVDVEASSAVPEPASLPLALSALLGFGLFAKRRKKELARPAVDSTEFDTVAIPTVTPCGRSGVAEFVLEGLSQDCPLDFQENQNEVLSSRGGWQRIPAPCAFGGTMRRMILLSAAGLFGVCAAYGANIVLNPGFETGNFTSWTTDTNGNWVVNSAGFILPHSGNFFAATGCTGASCITTPTSFVAQTLTTAVNQTYTLTFWYDRGTNNFNRSTGTEELLVLWNGTPAIDLIQTTSGNVDPGWTQFTVMGLTASSTSTRLEFRGRQDPAGLGLDDVDVESSSSAVPEPASLPLALSALLGFGLFAKCRSTSLSSRRIV